MRRTLFSTPSFISAIDTDAVGENIIVVDDRGKLYRWSGGALQHISDGAKAAEW